LQKYFNDFLPLLHYFHDLSLSVCRGFQ